MLGGWDIAIIIFVVLVVIVLAFYFLNRWASTRMVQQQSMIEQHKQPASIYVIDKKKEKLQNANLPKAVMEQMPKWNRFMKMHLVKAKVGPQIVTLMCEKDVFEAITVKKTIKVDLAGMFIVSVKGMKNREEMAALRKERGGGFVNRAKRLIGMGG